ncbi:fructosamine kinase family protein [Nocardioides panacisoli]|uniref:fructosamine kinase family protein n=1 Tax=Nocardioides panacisoli TaxID=627624 RepID=UPI001C6312B8|nr:fructosamine kinase family protein [Nocardioides panacisoli]QYJ03159.1 fructosamine kinase family protein [Nocardioides panacisoli]
MARQAVVADRAEQLLGTSVIATAPVAGGDVATAFRLRLSNGRTAFLKTIAHPPAGFFEREAAGLRWLAEADGVAVPEVLAVDPEMLVIEWVETTRPSADAAAGFGRALARMHGAGAASFGGEADGFIARLPLYNKPLPTWAEFYNERRIAPYLRVLRDKELISASHADAIERAAARVGDLVPEEPPARLHGDLWNGNVLWGTEDRVHVIDPAAHAGHREADLAMLTLFGLPQLPQVVAAYDEAAPLAEGWEDRLGLHQLFPLLVHACLFGGGYAARAATVAERYL